MSSGLANQAVRVSQIPPWERRRHPRFELKTETLVVDASRHTQSCKSGDISRGGACVMLDQPLGLGQIIEVWFKVAGTPHVECEAEVVRSEPGRIGIKFFDMNAFQMRQLDQLFESVRGLD